MSILFISYFCPVSTYSPNIQVTSVQGLTFVQQGLSQKLKNVLFSSFEENVNFVW